AALVAEVAEQLLTGLRRLGVELNERQVLVGAVLHDCGKIVHPEELSHPGSRHEAAGRELLLRSGYPSEIADICSRHAQWRLPGCSLEDLVVVLADNLWKGKREDALEALVVERVCRALGREPWRVFCELDTCFETLSAAADERLRRSREGF